MARQSIRWTDWIVVDDGIVPTRCTLGQRYIRQEPGLAPSTSFARNIRAGLREHANCRDSEYVFFIEDDDWYGPDYIASLLVGLTSHDLAGESHHCYYNVSERSYYHCGNAEHAALSATACRAALIPDVLSLVDEKNVYLDLRMWNELDCSKHLQQTRHCVGLKAQAGRPGLAWGHQQDGFVPDRRGSVLRKWFGVDAQDVLKHAIANST
jgi:hypothetical protein